MDNRQDTASRTSAVCETPPANLRQRGYAGEHRQETKPRAGASLAKILEPGMKGPHTHQHGRRQQDQPRLGGRLDKNQGCDESQTTESCQEQQPTRGDHRNRCADRMEETRSKQYFATGEGQHVAGGGDNQCRPGRTQIKRSTGTGLGCTR